MEDIEDAERCRFCFDWVEEDDMAECFKCNTEFFICITCSLNQEEDLCPVCVHSE